MLRRGDALVAENFGEAFDGHVVAQGHGGGEGVSGDVEGELFGYAAMLGYFLKSAVNLLVAGDGEERLHGVGGSEVGVVLA